MPGGLLVFEHYWIASHEKNLTLLGKELMCRRAFKPVIVINGSWVSYGIDQFVVFCSEFIV